MESGYILDYAIFLAKFGTVVLAIGFLALLIFFLVMRSRAATEEHLEIKNINQKFDSYRYLMQSAVLPKKEFKKSVKAKKQEDKSRSKPSPKSGGDSARKKLYVLRFDGDIRANEVNSLREEITALLTIADTGDEILVILESGGGTVHGYGLAASQLKRVRDHGIKLVVAVDKMAASGGYMMACVAGTIIAAPFAIIGSIGVLAQIPNFNRLLKKHDIDFEQISAGKYKRTLSVFGENTEEDRQKVREELEETHNLFKQFVKENREQVDIEKISTGEHWYGTRALELGLIDAVKTSDDYLYEAAENTDIYELKYVRKKQFLEKLFSSAVSLFKRE